MHRVLIVFFMSVFLHLVFPPLASSTESLPHIKKLYSDYKDALAQGNMNLAVRAANKVWAEAEDIYGDSSQTGDFAYNYAVIRKAMLRGKRDKKVEKAFLRSIALAEFHGEDAPQVSLKRNYQFATYYIQLKKKKKARMWLDASHEIAQFLDLMNTKEYALISYQYARLNYSSKNYQEAKADIDIALNIFEKRKSLSSKDAYRALYMKANIDMKLGNDHDALLGYEKIYVNKNRDLNGKDPLIGRAYLMKLHLDKDTMGKPSCFGCWPNIDEKYMAYTQRNKGYRFVRTPPTMPHDAMSSAFVVIMYDTDDEGTPINFRLIGGSHAVTFDVPTIKAMKKWKVYISGSDNLLAENEKDLVSTMHYYLSNRHGKILDFYGLPIDEF